jgi:hypothetical protein
LLFSFRRGRDGLREVAFTLCLIALTYTHSLGGLMVIALALGYLLDRRHSALTWDHWAAIHAAAFLAILPWASHYLDHPPDPKQNLERSSLLFDWMAYGLGLPLKFLPAVVGLVALGWWTPSRFLKGNGGKVIDAEAGDHRARTGLMLACWISVPVLLMAAYTLLRHPILGPIRYHTNLMPGVILLVVGSFHRTPRLGVVVLLWLVSAYTMPSLSTLVYDPQIKPDWREAFRQILRRSPEPVIVLAAVEPHMYYDTVDYYLPSTVPVISLETYRQRLAAGSIDRSLACWLLHDRLDQSEIYLERLTPERIASPEIGLGRLRIMQLDAALLDRLGWIRRARASRTRERFRFDSRGGEEWREEIGRVLR